MRPRYIVVGLTAFTAIVTYSATAATRHVTSGPKPEVARGEIVYKASCIACHGAGIGNPGLEYEPGTDALRAKYNGQEPPVLSDREDLAADYIRYVVRNGLTLMPFFRKTEVSDTDLTDLQAYLTRNNAQHTRP